MKSITNILIITLLFIATSCYSDEKIKENIQLQTQLEKSFSFMKNAAEQGSSLAQFFLGIMYANGDGVLKDHKQTVVWFRKAAE